MTQNILLHNSANGLLSFILSGVYLCVLEEYCNAIFSLKLESERNHQNTKNLQTKSGILRKGPSLGEFSASSQLGLCPGGCPFKSDFLVRLRDLPTQLPGDSIR